MKTRIRSALVKLVLIQLVASITGQGLVWARTVTVGTFTALADAVGGAEPGDTILLRDGTYTVDNGYGLQVRTERLVIKSLSDQREKVIVRGAGMAGEVEYGFWIPAHHVTIQSLTIQDVANHCIQTDVGNRGLRVIDCVLRDAYEQLLKVPFSEQAGPSDSGLVRGCLFEFSAGVAANYYTGGIDCHRARDWTVANNTFMGIRSPAGSLAEHAIHFWNRSENIVVENNLIVDCDRGIGFGMGSQALHRGGIIRNNMIHHRRYAGTDFGDAGIILENCTDALVYNNTIFFDHDYPNAIEYRFTGTTGVLIANNLTNRIIQRRDGASATVSNNVTTAEADWFVAPAAANLHLASDAIGAVIDKGTALDGLIADIDDDPRPQGDGIDIGADEYVSVGVRLRMSTDAAAGFSRSVQKRLQLQGKRPGKAGVTTSAGPVVEWYDLRGGRIGASRAAASIHVGKTIRSDAD